MSASPAPPSDAAAKRRWWLAWLFMLVAANGYLYVGRPTRYFACLAGIALLIALFFIAPGAWLSQPAVFFAVCGLALAAALFVFVDLIRLSLKQPDYTLQWYNRWWVYLATFVVSSALSFGPDLLGGRATQSVRTFSIPSVSGAPALQVGDYIVVNNRAYRSRDPARGDVVVFSLPRDENTIWIKRIIGLPGDKVQLKDGVVYINASMLKQEAAGRFAATGEGPRAQLREQLPSGRSYLILDAGPSAGDNTKAFTVPAGHYFLMGDNRDNSADSRFARIGMVPRAHVLGRAVSVIFADDLSRIGSAIE